MLSITKVDHLLSGSIAVVTHAGRLTWSGAGYVGDQRSTGVKAPPTDQSILD